MRLYLCSRLAPDARDLNDKVARYLRARGYSVFVPHEAHHNERPDTPDEEVYLTDKAEMQLSDACVVVGKVGVDCAFEVGWFEAYGTPTVWVFAPGRSKHPMLHGVPKVRNTIDLGKFLASIDPLFLNRAPEPRRKESDE